MQPRITPPQNGRPPSRPNTITQPPPPNRTPPSSPTNPNAVAMEIDNQAVVFTSDEAGTTPIKIADLLNRTYLGDSLTYKAAGSDHIRMPKPYAYADILNQILTGNPHITKICLRGQRPSLLNALRHPNSHITSLKIKLAPDNLIDVSAQYEGFFTQKNNLTTLSLDFAVQKRYSIEGSQISAAFEKFLIQLTSPLCTLTNISISGLTPHNPYGLLESLRRLSNGPSKWIGLSSFVYFKEKLPPICEFERFTPEHLNRLLSELKKQSQIVLYQATVEEMEALYPAFSAADSNIKALLLSNTLPPETVNNLIAFLNRPIHQIQRLDFTESLFYSMSDLQIENFFKMTTLNSIGLHGGNPIKIASANPNALARLGRLTQQKNITGLHLSKVSADFANAALKLLTHPDNNITNLTLTQPSIESAFALTPLFQRQSKVTTLQLNDTTIDAWHTLCLALRDQQNNIHTIFVNNSTSLASKKMLADLRGTLTEKTWFEFGDDNASFTLRSLAPTNRDPSLLAKLRERTTLLLTEPTPAFIESFGPDLFSEDTHITDVCLDNPSEAAVDALLPIMLSDAPPNVTTLWIANLSRAAMEKLREWFIDYNSRLKTLGLGKNLPQAVLELLSLDLKHPNNKINHLEIGYIPQLLLLPFLDNFADDKCNVKSIKLDGKELDGDSLTFFFKNLISHPYYKIEKLGLKNISTLDDEIKKLNPSERNNLNLIDLLMLEAIDIEAIRALAPLLFSKEMNATEIILRYLKKPIIDILYPHLLHHLNKRGKKTIKISFLEPDAACELFLALKHKEFTLQLGKLSAKTINAILDEAEVAIIRNVTIDWQALTRILTPEQKQRFEKLARPATNDFDTRRQHALFQQGTKQTKRPLENNSDSKEARPTKKSRKGSSDES